MKKNLFNIHPMTKSSQRMNEEDMLLVMFIDMKCQVETPDTTVYQCNQFFQ